jgi:hypothetical protein
MFWSVWTIIRVSILSQAKGGYDVCAAWRARHAAHTHIQPFTESDDTRWCDNKICPPEDGYVNA